MSPTLSEHRTPKSFYPPVELLAQVKEAAARAGIKESAWIIEACREKLERERQEAK